MREPTVAASSLLALLVDTPLRYRHMAASVKSPSRMPTTDRVAALRLQLVATEMSLRVGRRIRQRREELGIRTQRELADLIPSTTVTNQTINKWEQGANEPTARYKAMLAEALDVDVAYFIAEEPKGATPDPFPADELTGELAGVLQDIKDQLVEQNRVLAEIKVEQAELRGLIDGTAELRRLAQEIVTGRQEAEPDPEPVLPPPAAAKKSRAKAQRTR
jgi:transcriptional regulator with XRE-family HTH domain